MRDRKRQETTAYSILYGMKQLGITNINFTEVLAYIKTLEYFPKGKENIYAARVVHLYRNEET